MPNRRRLALAAAAGAGIVAWAPFADIARASFRDVVPTRFAAAVAAILAAAILTAVATGLARIRAHARREPSSGVRPVARLLLLGLAIAVGVVYARVARTGEPDVDAVERLHFLQYGLLTWLFYRAWLPAGDWSVLVAPALAGVLVGTLDEWFQWLIPYRVGEAHDVFINSAAIACGLLFSVGVEPPRMHRAGVGRGSARELWRLAAVTGTVFVLFFNAVHVGYEIRAAGGSRFLSSLSVRALSAAADDRARRWRAMTAPAPAARVSVEDRYLTEGLWHVQKRNQQLGEGKLADAWSENRILEEFYGPVLDRPISSSPSGSRLSSAEIEKMRAAAIAGGYVSDANPVPFYIIRR